MIVVTGGAGFIGSNIVAELEEAGHDRIAVADWFGTDERWRNVAKRRLAALVDPDDLPAWLGAMAGRVEAVIHMGAISSTTERDVDRLVRLNVNFSVRLWDWCAANEVPFLYASSAATYGGLESGFSDDDSPAALAELRPLNAYGWSKKATDDIFVARVARGEPAPPQWVGLKFFNVYGPNEYHKADMKSVAVKLFETVQSSEPVRLFKSYRDGVPDGEQRRDFVYVKDAARTILRLLGRPDVSGVFNLGTGRARSFLDIAKSLGLVMNRALDVEFIEMPEALRDRYQYFTQADTAKLSAQGIDVTSFHSLEDGVADYVEAYLRREDRYR